MYLLILLRWIWRFLIWADFLFRVSRLSLVLRPGHPDLAGGLGYLGVAQQSFVTIFLPSQPLLRQRLLMIFLQRVGHLLTHDPKLLS